MAAAPSKPSASPTPDKEVDVSLLVAPVKLSGSAMGMFFTFRDIREQKEQEAKLHHDAMHDVLTAA